jgi:hypothetical protein
LRRRIGPHAQADGAQQRRERFTNRRIVVDDEDDGLERKVHCRQLSNGKSFPILLAAAGTCHGKCR